MTRRLLPRGWSWLRRAQIAAGVASAVAAGMIVWAFLAQDSRVAVAAVIAVVAAAVLSVVTLLLVMQRGPR